MARMIYGDSYGQIGQEELARDAARDSRYFRSLDHQQALAQMAQQQQQQELASRFALMKFIADQRQQQVGNQFAQEGQQYNRGHDFLNLMLKNRELEQQNKIAQMRYGDLAGERDYGEAQQAITGGMLTPDQLPGAFPNLTPLHRNRLASYFKNLSDQEAADSAAGQGAANTLNEQLSLMRLSKGVGEATSAATKEKKGMNFLPWNRSEKEIDAELAATTKKLMEGKGRGDIALDPAALSTFLNTVLKNRRYSESVQWDPDMEAFVPAPIPRRFARPTIPAPTIPGMSGPASASAPTVPPPAVGAILQQAQEAIRLGADPAKVRARLQAMGLQPQ